MMSQLTDAALWKRAAAGDGDAFGEIFERHARTVYNYRFRRTGDWSQAEELTAIVFLEAWRRRRQIELDRDDAIPWLLGVATNLTRNLRRTQRRYRAALERLPRDRAAAFADDLDERLDVFPSSRGNACGSLGLAPLPAGYAAEATRFAALRNAIVGRLGEPASGASRRGPQCVGKTAAIAYVRRQLDARGYGDWQIEIAGGDFTAARPCAEPSFDTGAKTVYLLPAAR